MIFDLGAPGVPKEATKQPRYRRGTPNGRPKVPKGLKGVWKWSPKVAKSLTISSKRLCNDTHLSHKHTYNTKTHNLNKQTKKETNQQTNKQARKQTRHKKTQNKRLRPVADCRAASLDIYIYIYIYTYNYISLDCIRA